MPNDWDRLGKLEFVSKELALELNEFLCNKDACGGFAVGLLYETKFEGDVVEVYEEEDEGWNVFCW